MGLSDFQPVFIILNTALSIGAMLYAWLTSKAGEALKAARATAERVDDIDRRLTAIEASVGQLPDREVFHRLELALGGVRSDVMVLTERLVAITAISERLQEFLLDRGRA